MPRDQTIDTLLSVVARAVPFGGAIKQRIGQQVMSEQVLRDLLAFVPNPRGSRILFANLTWQSVRSTFLLPNLRLRRDRPAVFEQVTVQAFCADCHAEAEALAAWLERAPDDLAVQSQFSQFEIVAGRPPALMPRGGRTRCH